MNITQAKEQFRDAKSVEERANVYRAYFKGRFDNPYEKKSPKTKQENNFGDTRIKSKYDDITIEQLLEDPLIVFDGNVM